MVRIFATVGCEVSDRAKSRIALDPFQPEQQQSSSIICSQTLF